MKFLLTLKLKKEIEANHDKQAIEKFLAQIAGQKDFTPFIKVRLIKQ